MKKRLSNFIKNHPKSFLFLYKLYRVTCFAIYAACIIQIIDTKGLRGLLPLARVTSYIIIVCLILKYVYYYRIYLREKKDKIFYQILVRIYVWEDGKWCFEPPHNYKPAFKNDLLERGPITVSLIVKEIEPESEKKRLWLEAVDKHGNRDWDFSKISGKFTSFHLWDTSQILEKIPLRFSFWRNKLVRIK
jgi:hypothetical protein